MQDTDLMLHTLLELGESMLADGADVRRVEQTLSRMGKAYGAVRMDVFVITSSIVLTMCFADGSAATQTRRIEKSAAGLDGKEPVVIGQDRQDAVRLLIFGCPEDKPPCRQVHRLLPVCSWRMLRVRRPCRADTPPARRSR